VGEPWKDLVSIPSSDAMGRGVIVSMAAGYEVTVWLESIRVSMYTVDDGHMGMEGQRGSQPAGRWNGGVLHCPRVRCLGRIDCHDSKKRRRMQAKLTG
jgi:hypothetical protein